jgi:RNA polymerase sigma-B factor
MLAATLATSVPPAAQDEYATELIAKLAACPAGDPAKAGLRTQAIEAWLPMAERLAHRYAGRGEPFDDLRQTATIGLIKAVDRFDPERGTDFVGYALPTILGEIRRYFRDRAWSVRVPRRLQERWLAINEATAACQARLGRTPTITDLAAHLGLSDDDVIEGLEGARAYRAISLSAPCGDDGSRELGDTLGANDNGYELAESHEDLRPALARLSERERLIITLRFYGNRRADRCIADAGLPAAQQQPRKTETTPRSLSWFRPGVMSIASPSPEQRMPRH